MCGLIGYSGKQPFIPTWVEVLILWNALERGEDSTGVWTPVNGEIKSLDKGSHFVLMPENEIKPDTMLIGHVRASTVGKSTLKNCHPFNRGTYWLAHNGTLQNHFDMMRHYKLPFADYEVDSDMLCGSIATADSIVEVIKGIKGAAALIMHDTNNPDILYVFRNKERPLMYGKDIRGGIYISSTQDPLYFLKLKGVREFKEDILYTIEAGKITKTQAIVNEPLVCAPPPPPVVIQTDFERGMYEADPWKNNWIRAKQTRSFNYGDGWINLIRN